MGLLFLLPKPSKRHGHPWEISYPAEISQRLEVLRPAIFSHAIA